MKYKYHDSNGQNSHFIFIFGDSKVRHCENIIDISHVRIGILLEYVSFF